jgi:hypothetical protein
VAGKLLSDVEYRMGSLFAVANPNAWMRITKKFQLSGNSKVGQFVRGSLVYDACRITLAPKAVAVRQLNGNSRILASVDTLTREARVYLGQRIPLLDIHGKAGLKQVTFAPEVHLGVDIAKLEPTYGFLMNDDDYNGLTIKPLMHPAVLLSGAGLYAAMMRWRLPFSATITAAALKLPQDQSLELQLFTKTRREANNRITTVNLTGAMLTLRI